jgi:hypothetical protein
MVHDPYIGDPNAQRCEAGSIYCPYASEFAEILGHTGPSHAVIRALVLAEVFNLQQFNAMSDEELLAIPKVGRQTIERLRAGRPGERRADRRTLNVTDDLTVEFLSGDAFEGRGRARFTVVTASGMGKVPLLSLEGEFHSREAAAEWAGREVGHDDWVVARLHRTEPRTYRRQARRSSDG